MTQINILPGTMYWNTNHEEKVAHITTTLGGTESQATGAAENADKCMADEYGKEAYAKWNPGEWIDYFAGSLEAIINEDQWEQADG